MKKGVFRVICYLFVLLILSFTGCKSKKSTQQEVVIYTSLDKVFSQPILEAFERKIVALLKKLAQCVKF